MNSAQLESLAYDVAGRAWGPAREYTAADGAVVGTRAAQCAIAGRFAGQTVYIVGSGPSAAKFPTETDRLGRWHTDDLIDGSTSVIACNAAIRLVPQADVWLTSEMSVHLHAWFGAAQDFGGIAVMEAGITRENAYRPPVSPKTYPEAFWRRVLWHTRYSLAYERDTPLPCLWDHDFREPQGGLAVVQDLACGVKEGLGTVALRALHLAMLGGARRVVFYGCELMFESGPREPVLRNAGDSITHASFQQYATDDRAYAGPAPDDQWTNERVWFGLRIINVSAPATGGTVQSIEPYEDGSCFFLTTRLMLHSSVALRAVLERCAELGLEWEDRSGGLLDPAKLWERQKAEGKRQEA